MAKFVNLVLLLMLAGCASVQAPGYISRIDHPYERKYDADVEKVTSAVTYVLKKQGWVINSEADPAIYERDDRYDNNGYQNLLIITESKKKLLSLKSVHLNVFIHSIENTSDVEIRLSSGRNDQMVQGIFDAVDQVIHG